MSLDGTTYCYRNPLAFDPSSGDKIRNPWYDVTCCPPNLERTFASLPGYFYSTSKDGVYVHLYDNSRLDWRLENGTPLEIRQKTGYPWEGEVQMTVSPAQAADFTLYLRVPGWVRQATVAVNGQGVKDVQSGHYLALARRWKPGDTVSLNFPMPTEIVVANPRIPEDAGRIAVQRGPVVYCLEGLDQPELQVLSDVAVVVGQSPAAFEAEHKAELLGGVTVLRHQGAALQPSSAEDPLYRLAIPRAPGTRPQKLTLIPYYAWANREPAAMEVWVPYLRT